MTKSKMQNVNFKSISEFLGFLPDNELEIVEALRQIISDCIPDYEEKLSYNVPYFKRYSNICFLWPASVIWGNDRTYEGVRLGFINGYLIPDDLNYLEKSKRNQVFWKDYHNINEINVDVIKMYLFEANFIDEMKHKKKQNLKPHIVKNHATSQR
jgi:hypothetical protein